MLLHDEGGPGTAGQNVVIILSNFAYAFPAVQCILMKKYVQAFVFFGVMITSTLYHTCKFGAFDVANPEGWCLILDFRAYYFLDHLFALTTIPCLFMSLTSLDVIVFDTRRSSSNATAAAAAAAALEDDDASRKKRKPKDADVEDGLGRNAPPSSATTTIGTVKIKFLFGWLWRWMSKCRSRRDTVPSYGKEGGEDRETLITSYASKKDFKSRFEYENSFVATNETPASPSNAYVLLKRSMSGLEHAYILSYAYLIGVGLLLRLHSDVWFYIALVLSCLGVIVILGVYFYVKHGIISCFKSLVFWPGVVLAVCALVLMGVQDFLPPETYWVTHSMWHVTSGLGIWLIYLSKYLYCCYHN